VDRSKTTSIIVEMEKLPTIARAYKEVRDETLNDMQEKQAGTVSLLDSHDFQAGPVAEGRLCGQI